MDRSATISAVTISVDGAIVQQATYGTNRQDACDVVENDVGCPNVGYTFEMDTSQFASGAHTLTAVAITSDGRQTGQSVTFYTNNSSSSLLWIDVPGSQQTYSGAWGFYGWAMDPTAQIASVTVAIDGAPYGEATYGGNRQDACNVIGNNIGCPNVGWNFSIDTSQLADGPPHIITVTAVTTDSRQTSRSAAFYTGNAASSAMWIDTPGTYLTYSGTQLFGGWAMNSSTTVSTVGIVIDGQSYGNANYGNNRQDACNVITNDPGCPYVGYTFNFATNRLPDGLHWITVTATTASSAQTVRMGTFFTNNSSSGSGGSCPGN